jgi:hypothetical protein
LGEDKSYTLCKNDIQTIVKSKNIMIVTPKKVYKKQLKRINITRKRVRHSKQMKETLKQRIQIEHFNKCIA